MKKRKRTSPIWKIPKDKFEELVKKSNSIAEVIRFFGFANASGYYKMIKKRCNEDKIDYSHIKLGLNSNKGRKFPQRKIPLEEILIKNSIYNRGSLKKRLLKEKLLENECAICGLLPEWNEQKLIMVLDHINGVRDDNRLENLRLLCPNCNSQQDTFAGRNNKRIKKKYFCEKCGKERVKGSVSELCKKCFDVKQRKVNRPSKEELIELIKITPMTQIGKKYNVSDKSVAKWAKSYRINIKEISPFVHNKIK